MPLQCQILTADTPQKLQDKINKFLQGHWHLKIIRNNTFSSMYVIKNEEKGSLDMFYNFGMVLWYTTPAQPDYDMYDNFQEEDNKK